MRKNNYDSLLYISIFILVLSSVMLAIAGYQLYFKSNSNSNKTIIISSSGDNRSVRDSLQHVYNSTLKKMDDNVQLAGVSLENNTAQTMLAEMDRLKQEIAALLKDQRPDADLSIAKEKIDLLQQKLEILQDRYTNINTENKRLQQLINQLMASDKNAGTVSSIKAEKEKNSADKNVPARAAGMHLYATMLNNAAEEETSTSENAEKIVGSFYIKNIQDAKAEILVVVLQPDGKVVSNSAWETGTFNTAEGKKIYSRKIYVEEPGDEKPLNFSLTPDRFLKGDYTLQVWYNGTLIGKTTRKLS
ncbi:MAG: hypothetical protein ABIY51_16145 [Ferruginibacter sp.]